MITFAFNVKYLKGYVRYILEKACENIRKFLLHFKSSFCSWDIQALESKNLKFNHVIKRLSMKQEVRLTE